MGGFDWRRYWAEHDENEGAARFALFMADKLDELFDWRRVSSFADFGCGPATMLFALAERHHGTRFRGFDVSEPVLAKNMAKARDAKLNLAFSHATLPDIETAERFDIVTCLSTLHYVEKIAEAIRSLYTIVSEGGYLIFNYPNIYTHWMYRRDVKQDDEETGRRFSLILNKRNILTQKTIRRITGAKPEKIHSAIRGNIYVSLRKPSSKKHATGARKRRVSESIPCEAVDRTRGSGCTKWSMWRASGSIFPGGAMSMTNHQFTLHRACIDHFSPCEN